MFQQVPQAMLTKNHTQNCGLHIYLPAGYACFLAFALKLGNDKRGNLAQQQPAKDRQQVAPLLRVDLTR